MVLPHINIGSQANIKGLFQNQVLEYMTSVASIGDNNFLTIYAPFVEDEYLFPIVGKTYSLSVYTSRKGILKMTGAITSLTEEAVKPTFTVKIIKTGENIQRREFYRLENMLEVSLASPIILSDDVEDFIARMEASKENDAGYGYSPFRMVGYTKNISVGGASIYTDIELYAGDTPRIKIAFEDYNFTADCVILFKKPISGSRFHFNYGITFVDMSRQQTQTLTKYIYRQQRKLLGK